MYKRQLQGQLEVKDRQIAKLTEALVAAQQTAAAAQALHAGTMKQDVYKRQEFTIHHHHRNFVPFKWQLGGMLRY